jgi:hypothetical protein
MLRTRSWTLKEFFDGGPQGKGYEGGVAGEDVFICEQPLLRDKVLQ